MSKRTLVILLLLFSCCAGLLAGGLFLTRDLARALAANAPASVGELKVTIKEWAVPSKGAQVHDPAVGSDGALWFTERMQNKIGRLDPTGNFTEYPLEVPDSDPHGLVADPSGKIWFTSGFAGYIGKLDPQSGVVAQYKIPDSKAKDPETLVFDSRGILWFTVPVANMVGRLDPQSGKMDLRTVPTNDGHPYGMAINSKGVPFFCELAASKVARMDPASMQITEYQLPERVRPRRMAIDSKDRIYFTDYRGGQLGRLDPASGAVKLWPSPGGLRSNPCGITITSDGLVWYSESGVKPNTIVQFNPATEAFARAKVPSGGTVRNMAVTSDGRIYIACSGVDRVAIVERRR